MKLKQLLLILFLTPLLGFSQNETLWMRYPAISPDGSKIAFSYKGDLYLVNSKGGLATALTRHNAHDRSPVWSNDGKTLAFASDRFGNFDIFTIPVSGGSAKQITFHSRNDQPASFSPDDKFILFNSARLDNLKCTSCYPGGRQEELYKVSVDGGRVKQLLTTPANFATYNSSGDLLLYENKPGGENYWRKHHTSSVTRDIMIYNPKDGSHKYLTNFKGEDREPVWGKNDEIYYLSEQSGSLNIWTTNSVPGSTKKQVTNFSKHPVRFLSISNDGLLSFSFNGELYTMKDGEEANKLNISVIATDKTNENEIIPISGGISDFALSPNGKELAFIVRGEVFVTSVEHSTTKRITNSPEKERNLDFSPDGRSILYSSERNGSWNIYESTLASEDEDYFYTSTLIDEKAILEVPEETFQATYSPDGKEIAYIEERATLKVHNLASKKSREVLAPKYNYSYSDGDFSYQWSPDGKWFLVDMIDNDAWIGQVGIVKADGKSEPVNISQSGYSDNIAKWMPEGKGLYWYTSRYGMRPHASWGGQADIVAAFFTQDAYDKFTLSKVDYELFKEQEEKRKKEEKKDDSKEKDKKKKEDTKDDLPEITVNLEDINDRRARLTSHSSTLSGVIMAKNGEKIYYLSRFEGGYDLWVKDFYKQETKLLSKLNGGNSSLVLDKEGKHLYAISSGRIKKIDVSNGKTKGVAVKAEMVLNKSKERSYMFEHAWRQMKKKFYRVDLHKVDWEFYKKEYARFLPHIDNNYDFAEMLSELLGEINASHTGSGYRKRMKGGASTASLGVYYDEDYAGDGLKIAKLIAKSPLTKAKSKVKAGTIIEKINGKAIKSGENYIPLFNRIKGQNTRLHLYDPSSKERWEEVVKPISLGMESFLLYREWVKSREEETDRLSNGQLGYVHVRGMDDGSFREIFSKIIGKYNTKKGLIVDTRYNGGGWLHEDLVTFLNGKEYMRFSPRGQENMGAEPLTKWAKPSIVIMNQFNYSDAHIFPYAYKTLEVGKLLGMPVPGTGTAVWWESLIDNSIYFGIPQVGLKDLNGNYLENQQLEPDIKVENDPASIAEGKDKQLEAAVKELLK